MTGLRLHNTRPLITLRNRLITEGQRCVISLCLLFPLIGAAQQFVDVTAEIEGDNWGGLFFNDQKGPKLPDGSRLFSSSIFHSNAVYHCVVGTSSWLVERGNENGKFSSWFTGTNIIEQWVRPNAKPYREAVASVDGNPGQPVRVQDRIDPVGRICWLAFCSGSFLARDGRQIYPPADQWKEAGLLLDSRWSEQTTVFPDAFGLPKSVTLFATNHQPILQYQARGSTNVLGWNFPLEFYLVQYLPDGTNGWKLELTAKGRVTAIGVGNKPSLPSESPGGESAKK